MDASVFWEIIETARTRSGPVRPFHKALITADHSFSERQPRSRKLGRIYPMLIPAVYDLHHRFVGFPCQRNCASHSPNRPSWMPHHQPLHLRD
jgi:hypothetical protein